VRITEIYKSIQGETRFAGRPCTLVRTTGCDLRCGYCDSAFSFYGGREMSTDEILAEVDALGAPLVLLTGGEPLLQRDMPALSQRLLDKGYEVMIETSGSQPTAPLPRQVVRILDLKTPGSGESAKMRWENLTDLVAGDAVKLVLRDEQDYLWAKSVLAQHALAEGVEVLMSPSFGELDPATLVSWMLRDGLRARLNLQLHKFIWNPDARGV